jgi:hypothetical protein
VWRICIAVVLSAACAVASAATRSEKIRELMEAQGLVQMYEQQIQAGREHTRKIADDTVGKMLSTLNPPARVQTRIRDAARAFVLSAQPTWTARDIVEVWGKYYGAKFSDEELDQLLQYYRSPLGQKDVMASREALVPFTAEFQARYNKILEKATQAFAERLQAIVRDCNCKKRHETGGT